MKLVCESCDQVGEPAEVWQKGASVALECASCGHLNRVSGGEKATQAADEVKPTAPANESVESAETASSGKPASPAEAAAASPKTEEDTGVRVAREPEVSPDAPPFQCQKCGERRAEEKVACGRCGFLTEHYIAGEMPWEKELAKEDASEFNAQWEAALDAGTEASHHAFVRFCIAQNWQDLATRNYKFRLANRPDDTWSQWALEKVIEDEKVRLVTMLKTQKMGMSDDVQRAKRLILGATLFVGLLVAMLVIWLYEMVFA